MARPLVAEISLSALNHNLSQVRRFAPAARVFAVIKANGYGHGLLRVAGAFKQADGFAVLTLTEAQMLREAGFEQPILLLEGFFSADELPQLAKLKVSVVVHALWQVAAINAAPITGINVFLKINTGMNRLGIAPAEVAEVCRALRLGGRLNQCVLMTHFATADDDRGVADQLALFAAATDGQRGERCVANSAAILRYPQTHADWVRPGIMLYGASPFADQLADAFDLRPAMTLRSGLLAVQDIRPSDAVGYGRSFVADTSMRIGIVACGYADGYPRHAPTGTPVLVEGQRTRTVGRVSMDMLAVDLSDIPLAGVGSPVVLWGDGLPVEEVAAAAGTISYELLTALAPRVPVREMP